MTRTRRFPVASLEVQATLYGARVIIEWYGDSQAALAEIQKGEAGDPAALAELAEQILTEALEQVRHAIAHADVRMEPGPGGDA